VRKRDVLKIKKSLSGPRHGSRAYRSLVALYQCGAMGEAEWMEMSSFLQSRAEFQRDVVQQLLHWKLIATHQDGHRILEAGLRYLGVLPEEEKPGVPATGRYVPPRQDLSARNRPALRVMRPGAFDYRDIPSVHAGKQVAYRSSITVQDEDVTA
jgi:hypothetical protein